MSSFFALLTAAARAAGVVLAVALPSLASHAQGTTKESIPGGVEARPSDPTATAPKAMPSPAPAPIVGAPASRSISPQLETTTPKPAAPTAAPDSKGKSQKKSKVEPQPLTRSFAPGVPAAGAVTAPALTPPVAPPKDGKESMPGAVERSPGPPAPAPR